jgi:hypothetical protein
MHEYIELAQVMFNPYSVQRKWMANFITWREFSIQILIVTDRLYVERQNMTSAAFRNTVHEFRHLERLTYQVYKY